MLRRSMVWRDEVNHELYKISNHRLLTIYHRFSRSEDQGDDWWIPLRLTLDAHPIHYEKQSLRENTGMENSRGRLISIVCSSKVTHWSSTHPIFLVVVTDRLKYVKISDDESDGTAFTTGALNWFWPCNQPNQRCIGVPEPCKVSLPLT